MNEAFELETADHTGTPLLYLHGLGGVDDDNRGFQRDITELGFAVNTLHRDDTKVLEVEDPEALWLENTSEAIRTLYENTRKRVVLVGNSFGSYMALQAASANQDKVKAVLATDAFLNLPEGFNLIESRCTQMLMLAQRAAFENQPINPPFNEFPSKQKAAGNHHFVMPSTSNNWVNIPKGLWQRFSSLDLPKFRPEMPVHLIWGSKDELVGSIPPPHLVPQASHTEIAGMNHNDWFKTPDARAAALNFLARHV